MRSVLSKSGVRSLAGRRKGKVWRGLNGHEGESRIQPRLTWSHHLLSSGGQGVHREVESERHEEKYRAVIDGGTQDEPVGLCQEAQHAHAVQKMKVRTFGVVLQEKTPNSHELLQSKAVVVNVHGKGVT